MAVVAAEDAAEEAAEEAGKFPTSKRSFIPPSRRGQCTSSKYPAVTCMGLFNASICQITLHMGDNRSKMDVIKAPHIALLASAC
jgi:hypothetical protein